jgi:non-ribosomal peptide synthetase component F
MTVTRAGPKEGIMAETTIDPAQPDTAQAGTAQARPAGKPGPITADLGMIVTRAARRFGAKTALIAPGRTLTYHELDDLCDRVAGGLHDIGVRPGDRVSLYSPNRWEWVVAYHAALRAGAVINPINVMLTAEEVAFVLNDCGAAAIFTSGDKAEVIAALTREVPALRSVISFDGAGSGVTGFEDLLRGPAAAPEIPRPAPADLSTIGYTSGTTGHPKGAMQSHRAVFLNTAATFALHTRTDRDVMLNALPLPHVYGNVIMNGTFMDGGRPDHAGGQDGRMGRAVRCPPARDLGHDRTGRRGHEQLHLHAQRPRLYRLRSPQYRGPDRRDRRSGRHPARRRAR